MRFVHDLYLTNMKYSLNRLQIDYQYVNNLKLRREISLVNPDELQYLHECYARLVNEVVDECLPINDVHSFHVVLDKGTPNVSRAQLVRLNDDESVIKISLSLIEEFHSYAKKFFSFVTTSQIDEVSKSPFVTWIAQKNKDDRFIENIADFLFIKSAIACVIGHEAGHILSGQKPLLANAPLPSDVAQGREIGADGYAVRAGLKVFQNDLACSLFVPELHRNALIASKCDALSPKRLSDVLFFDLPVAQYAIVLAGFSVGDSPIADESWVSKGRHPADSLRLLSAAVSASSLLPEDVEKEGFERIVHGLLFVLGFWASQIDSSKENGRMEDWLTELENLLIQYDANPELITSMRKAYLSYLN